MCTKNTSQSNFLSELTSTLNVNDVAIDADSLSNYGKDWTKVFEPDPLAIVFPRSTEDVQTIVKLANKHLISLVPSGGRTGLSGGAMSTNKEVVVSFERMNKLSAFDPIDRSVVCEAGVITQQLQEFAKQQNLSYPVDFASSGSSQIGGNIATNAGGIKVIRYGLTRDWVIGLTVVTGNGDIMELNNGLIKNATGYDLRHLFIGSEGTLGFITKATIRLSRPASNLTVLVLGVPEFDALMHVSQTFRDEIDLTAFEFFSDKALELVTAEGVAKPFDTPAPYYALLEYEQLCDETEEKVMRLFEKCIEQEWVVDGVMSQNETQAATLWSLRENISETIAQFTPYKNDLSVTVSKVPAFLHKVNNIVNDNYPDFEIVWFGHIGDGNLHLNILKPANLDQQQFFSTCAEVSKKVCSTVAEFEGSISAEHGVGLLKKPYLKYTRNAQEIIYMQSIKKIFDANSIMNPGKLIDT
jgi:glycolate oxidase subunit GlcD